MAKSDWVKTPEACKSLGVSAKHLRRLRDEKLLKQGTHWRNIARPMATRPTYQWHLTRIEKVLAESAEERG